MIIEQKFVEFLMVDFRFQNFSMTIFDCLFSSEQSSNIRLLNDDLLLFACIMLIFDCWFMSVGLLIVDCWFSVLLVDLSNSWVVDWWFLNFVYTLVSVNLLVLKFNFPIIQLPLYIRLINNSDLFQKYGNQQSSQNSSLPTL